MSYRSDPTHSVCFILFLVNSSNFFKPHTITSGSPHSTEMAHGSPAKARRALGWFEHRIPFFLPFRIGPILGFAFFGTWKNNEEYSRLVGNKQSPDQRNQESHRRSPKKASVGLSFFTSPRTKFNLVLGSGSGLDSGHRGQHAPPCHEGSQDWGTTTNPAHPYNICFSFPRSPPLEFCRDRGC